ncbi:motile sperm domain-containing protein 1-like isoform X2 [Genypterus blacodes]|uniref:motile sperm domain-containing protein 1-like isoform X2 n=1 Tax=Genypterus blacodes TaxID=154954 RepID=UPI003F75A732
MRPCQMLSSEAERCWVYHIDKVLHLKLNKHGSLMNPMPCVSLFLSLVLCTAPSLYRVVEAEGSVRAKSCVDLVVRHLDVSSRNWGRRDRFRLEVRGGGQVGEREIWAELRGGREGEEEERRRRKKGGTGAEESRPEGQQRALYPLLVPTHPQLQIPSSTGVRSVSQWVVCFCVSVLCVSVLMLPLHTDSSSVVPPCLHVSTNQKLACAYTLGLLTMVFLR